MDKDIRADSSQDIGNICLLGQERREKNATTKGNLVNRNKGEKVGKSRNNTGREERSPSGKNKVERVVMGGRGGGGGEKFIMVDQEREQKKANIRWERRDGLGYMQAGRRQQTPETASLWGLTVGNIDQYHILALDGPHTLS